MTKRRLTLDEVYHAVIRVESKVEDIADHEERIRALERWRYTFPASLVLAMTSIVVTIIQR